MNGDYYGMSFEADNIISGFGDDNAGFILMQ